MLQCSVFLASISQSSVFFCWEPTKVGCSRPTPKTDKWPNFRAGTFGWRVDTSVDAVDGLKKWTEPKADNQPIFSVKHYSYYSYTHHRTIASRQASTSWFLVAVVSYESLLLLYRGSTAPSQWDICIELRRKTSLYRGLCLTCLWPSVRESNMSNCETRRRRGKGQTYFKFHKTQGHPSPSSPPSPDPDSRLSLFHSVLEVSLFHLIIILFCLPLLIRYLHW